ncbi:peptidase [Nocardiopsis sp. TSRI0078]|uniref:thioester domain-containing protein n=1 Tax=unclassified Nocardiopsis TaxID=2649073 RepID=UPI00093B352D|nr:thioester domain-containing protein [Nocardiopsis sp. TSRI0078]OKI14485.1 peptidase [Nocardiopsis sp. TSRI0078]
MTHVSLPRSTGRATLAASAAAFLAFGLAAPAAADPVETYEGAVRAQYVDHAQDGHLVTMQGVEDSIGTSTFNLRLENGDVLTTYCIDFSTDIRADAWYLEDQWATYPGKGDFAEPGKVHWILQNSYPSVSAADLASAARTARLTEAEALTATQAAIWHFSNGMELSRVTANKEVDSRVDSGAVTKVYRYLVDNAQELPQEPEPTLSITPHEASGKAGETVGEFLIETSDEDGIEVSPEIAEGIGVELVDIESGEPVTTVNNGDVVGFSVPAGAEAGQAGFSLETSATVRSGRLFKGEEEHQPTQTLITAEDSEVTVTASASASWTGDETTPPTDEPSDEPSEPESPEPTEPESPKPTEPEEPSDKPSEPADDQNEPTLPVTGGALAGLVAAGVAALGAGGGAIYLSRKRKAAGSEDLEG